MKKFFKRFVVKFAVVAASVAMTAHAALAVDDWTSSFTISPTPLEVIAGIVLSACGIFLIIKWCIGLAKGGR